MRRRNKSKKQMFRSVRAFVNLTFTAIILFALYVSVGSPALTPIQQFRREEKANLVGPASILDTISLKGYTAYEFEKLLIGSSDVGISLFCYNYYSWRHGHSLSENNFIYRSKAEDVTVFSIPNKMAFKYLHYYDTIKVPILVFADFPDAVRASLQIELYSIHATEPFREKFTLHASRAKEGYFLFELSIDNKEKRYGPIEAVSYFINICDDKISSSYDGVKIPVKVQFFNKSDVMISEYSVMIQQPINKIYA